MATVMLYSPATVQRPKGKFQKKKILITVIYSLVIVCTAKLIRFPANREFPSAGGT